MRIFIFIIFFSFNLPFPLQANTESKKIKCQKIGGIYKNSCWCPATLKFITLSKNSSDNCTFEKIKTISHTIMSLNNNELLQSHDCQKNTRHLYQKQNSCPSILIKDLPKYQKSTYFDYVN